MAPELYSSTKLRPWLIALLCVLLALLMNRPDPQQWELDVFKRATPPNKPSTSSNPPRLILGPTKLRCGVVQLEQHDGLQLPRLLVRFDGGYINDQDVQLVLQLFSKTLQRKRPFTVAWDMRKFVWPRVSAPQYIKVRDWVGENVVQWDTLAQCHALIITNPIAWAVVGLALRVFQPPQPRSVVRREELAIEFARSCCLRPRSWVKRSYADRSERHLYFSKMLARG